MEVPVHEVPMHEVPVYEVPMHEVHCDAQIIFPETFSENVSEHEPFPPFYETRQEEKGKKFRREREEKKSDGRNKTKEIGWKKFLRNIRQRHQIRIKEGLICTYQKNREKERTH